MRASMVTVPGGAAIPLQTGAARLATSAPTTEIQMVHPAGVSAAPTTIIRTITIGLAIPSQPEATRLPILAEVPWVGVVGVSAVPVNLKNIQLALI